MPLPSGQTNSENFLQASSCNCVYSSRCSWLNDCHQGGEMYTIGDSKASERKSSCRSFSESWWIFLTSKNRCALRLPRNQLITPMLLFCSVGKNEKVTTSSAVIFSVPSIIAIRSVSSTGISALVEATQGGMSTTNIAHPNCW